MLESKEARANSWLRWTVMLSVSVGFFALAQALITVANRFWHPPLSVYSFAWSASDWLATVGFTLSAYTLALKHRDTAILASTAVLTVWHTALILTTANHLLPSVLLVETIQTTGIIGIIISAALAYAHLKASGVLRNSTAYNASKNATESETVVSGAHPDRRFGPGDLALLERELCRNQLLPGEYFSAIQFAFAVERDCDFVNCNAERLRFNQIVLDSAMHLYVSNKQESMWLPIANAFRGYDQLNDKQRKLLVEWAVARLPFSCLAAH